MPTGRPCEVHREKATDAKTVVATANLAARITDTVCRRSGPDFPGPLGRVKAPFADAHRYAALTRPARSRELLAITGATAGLATTIVRNAIPARNVVLVRNHVDYRRRDPSNTT